MLPIFGKKESSTVHDSSSYDSQTSVLPMGKKQATGSYHHGSEGSRESSKQHFLSSHAVRPA